MRRILSVAALAASATAAGAQSAEQLRFIACPIYRDTDAGKKSGCWLADDLRSGARYDVSRSPSKPDWNLAILVEGKASSTIGNCGGTVLDPVRVSVLQDLPCTRRMLPAEGFKGNPFVLPKRNVRPLSVMREPPARPFKDATFSVPFDFDSSFLVYQLSDYLFDQAASYALAVHPKSVVVTGWAATDPARVSGQMITEDLSVARDRANSIAESLRRLGVPKSIIRVEWKGHAQPAPIEGADGLTEPSRRRVDIKISV